MTMDADLKAKLEVIEANQAARRFNPRNITDWLDMALKSGAFAAAFFALAAFVIRLLLPEWTDAPAKIEANTTAIEALGTQLSLSQPQVIDFKGNLIPDKRAVVRGQTIGMAMVVRRNVSCDTLVRVRFYNHRTNTIQSRQSYDIRAVKSPVSVSFSSFALQLFVPDDLPAGLYSYFPELVPLDCGVYSPVVSPMSLPFEVTTEG